MGVQNSNFAPKFSQNKGFLAQHFVFLDENFPTRRKFSNRQKCRRAIVPYRCHDVEQVVVQHFDMFGRCGFADDKSKKA